MSNADEQVYGGVDMPHYQGVIGSVHRLDRDWRVRGAFADGTIFEVCVAAGFTFDGASIPRALWRVCGHPLEVPRVAAALAHDWLYAAQLCDRKTADEIYLAICREVGISAWRCYVEYYALRAFGGAAWRSHRSPAAEKLARVRGSLKLNGLTITEGNINEED